jgi:hypothetical protein
MTCNRVLLLLSVDFEIGNDSGETPGRLTNPEAVSGFVINIKRQNAKKTVAVDCAIFIFVLPNNCVRFVTVPGGGEKLTMIDQFQVLFGFLPCVSALRRLKENTTKEKIDRLKRRLLSFLGHTMMMCRGLASTTFSPFIHEMIGGFHSSAQNFNMHF